MSALTDIKEAATRANDLMREIVFYRRSRMRKEAQLNKRIQKARDKYGPEIEELKTKEEDYINQLVDLVLPRFALLAFKGTRTIKLRNGEISLRTSRESLEIAEGISEAKIISRIARNGGLRRFTRTKRTIDKDALKKDPAFVAKIKGISITRKTSLIIKPARTQGEIVRETDLMSVPLIQD